MTQDRDDVEVGFRADLSGLVDGFGRASDIAKDGADKMTGSLTGVGNAVMGLKSMFLGLGAAIVSGFGIGEVINEVNQATFELDKMSTMLGKSLMDTRNLGDSLSLVGSSLESYAGITRMMTMRINQNEQAFKDAKVAIRDSNGDLLSADQIISNVVKRLQDFRAGQDQNTMAMRLAGRGYSELIALQRMHLVDQDKIAKGNEELVRIVGEYSVEATVKYRGAMQDVQDVMEATQQVIATAFMPVLTDMGSWFGDQGPMMVEAFKAVIDTVADVVINLGGAFVDVVSVIWDALAGIYDAIATVFSSGSDASDGMQFFKDLLTMISIAVIGFRVGIELMVNIVRTLLSDLGGRFVVYGEVAWRALHLDFKGAAAAYRSGMKDIEAAAQESQNELLRIAQKGQDDIGAAILGTAHAPRTDTGKMSGDERAIVKPTKTGNGGGDTRLSEWKAQLQEMKQADGDFFSTDLSVEESFWQAKLEKVRGHGKANIKLRQSINTELYNIHKQQAQQSRQLDEASIADEQKTALAGLAMEREQVAARKDMRQISDKAATQALVALADLEYQINLKALRDKLTLYASDKVQKQRVLDEMKQLDLKHAADTSKIYLDEARKRFAQQRALDEEAISHKQEMGRLDIEAERERISIKSNLGLIDSDAKIAAEIALSNRLFAIDQAALDAKLQQYRDDEVEYKKLLDQKEVLTKQHAIEIGKINGEQLQQQKKDIESMLEPVTSAIEQSIKGMIQGTVTWQKALRNIFQSILGEFISTVSKIAAQWITKELLMTSATQTGVATRAAIEQSGAALSMLSSFKTAFTAITNFASQAFAGVWAALSGIPIVGPAMAAAEAPMAMGAVLGSLGGLIPGHEAGIWQVPGNYLAQLHKDEMVLNKREAEDFRSGQMGGGGVTVNISAVDAAGVRRLFMNEGSALADAIRRQSRNFKPMTPVRSPL